mmetsp:Transcript_10663/g.23574  ORF Transcript_10663/g.23574 Transcript_10663/m.23574 type:complete len:244 (-) Transcript_10663:579-1310(-)
MMTSSLKFTDKIPDGFSLEHNQVQPEVWANILHWLSSDMLPASSTNMQEEAATVTIKEKSVCVPIPWETGPQMQGRKIAQFGNCRYDYVTDVAEHCAPSSTDDSGAPPPIPDYIRHTLLSREQNCQQYTQCIINMYEAKNEIPWHVDHEHFGPKVLVYTFGEERPLLLRKPLNDECMDDSDSITRKMNGNQNENEGTYIYARVLPRHCSKYVLSGPARHVWEHSVPSGKSDRVSITFRSWVGE